MASNPTRDEAHDRARLIDVRTYHVDLDLTGDDKVFESLTTVTFGCYRPGAGTFIDLTAESVTEIEPNSSLSKDRDGDGVQFAGQCGLEFLRMERETQSHANYRQ